MASATIRIPARFNGPPGSANGGYTCGLVAGAMGVDSAEVTLRDPPPLETDLVLEYKGPRVSLRDGDTLVAEGRPTVPALQLLEPVAPAQAAEAARAGRARWAEGHPFPTCVVCGPERRPGDGLRLSPGRLGGEGTFACDWTPDASLGDGDGLVRPEFVWAALDCPTSAPVWNDPSKPDFRPVVLARFATDILESVQPGAAHTILSWPTNIDGRKRHSAAALYTPDGEVAAISRALWIELKPPESPS